VEVENLEQETGGWRAAVRELTDRILWQLRLDREACKTVKMGGEWHRLASLTMDELTELARAEAIARTEEAIARDAA
jgi:Arc/MetJ-type ribon-helix-helix transcriptional regulator